MKFVILFFALFVSTQTQASYEDAYNTQILCKGVAKVGELSFLAKAAGKSIEETVEDVDRAFPNMPKRVQPTFFEAIVYGYNKAGTRKDAYMTGWTKCMDRFQ
jgi:hypothetical protein